MASAGACNPERDALRLQKAPRQGMPVANGLVLLLGCHAITKRRSNPARKSTQVLEIKLAGDDATHRPRGHRLRSIVFHRQIHL